MQVVPLTALCSLCSRFRSVCERLSGQDGEILGCTGTGKCQHHSQSVRWEPTLSVYSYKARK